MICNLFKRHVCLLALLSLSVTACHQASSPTEKSATSKSAESPIQFVAASKQLVLDQLLLNANVQADPTRSFRIFPPTSGRVMGIRVKPGDFVRKGEILAIIQSADAASAQSDLIKAQIEAERSRRAADREKVLLDHGAVAEKDYIDAKAAADAAQTELVSSRERLELLGMKAGEKTDVIKLLSPSKGIVLSVDGAAGEFSKSLDQAEPLVTIADLSTIWVVGDVFEQDIAKIQPGTKVTITADAFPGKQWTGHIDSIAGALDPATRTLKVRTALQNPENKLKPEMFAAIHVDVGEHQAVCIPATAVIHQGQNTIVYVEDNGRPAQRNVEIGQALDGKIEITSGLHAGENVAVNGAELLTGGSSQP